MVWLLGIFADSTHVKNIIYREKLDHFPRGEKKKSLKPNQPQTSQFRLELFVRGPKGKKKCTQPMKDGEEFF